MTTRFTVDFGGGRQMTKDITFPSNSHKLRAIQKNPMLPNQLKRKTNREGFYVKIEYNIWPEIYGKKIPYYFPTLDAALKFAEGNVSVNKPIIGVYTAQGILIEMFTYKE